MLLQMNEIGVFTRFVRDILHTIEFYIDFMIIYYMCVLGYINVKDK